MEIGKWIRTLRKTGSFSQDVLAEKIYVSRQTISNWENDENYPDVKSLLLLSDLFDTTLDTLVKGDIEEMKHFKREANIVAVLLLCTIILPVPLASFFGYIGWGIWGVIAA